VHHLAVHADGASRACRPAHLTAGTLVLSAALDEVLLTLHAKARRWFHLGGHCEPTDATLAGAARREATEESGIEKLHVDPVPVHLDRHVVEFCARPGAVHHLDVRFVAVAEAGAAPAASHESLDLRWWSVARLPSGDPGLQRLVDLALDRVQSPSSAN
jgi:8-oxo-dGTP pyrophosphatase MutT (NUDIX family)